MYRGSFSTALFRLSLACFFAVAPSFVVTGAFAGPVQPTVAASPFPLYPGISENVAFWKLVYTTYTSRQMIFHDSDFMMRIYGVKQVPAGVNPWSRQAQRMARFEKERYREILLKFSHGLQPLDEDEKRVFKLFGANATPDEFRFAADNLRTQLGQADRFRDGIIRSGLYMDHIKHVFAEHGLPEELAYLPHVESSFDYKAYSKFGAAGVWQFMRSTGRLYMKVNYMIDERRDPIRATVAAAQLLKYNYQQLGAWPLAVTAYNHGLAGMQGAMRRLGTSDYMKIFNEHDGRRFGFASRNFYSEFLAAKEVAANYKQHFGDLELMKPLNYEEVAIDQPIELGTIISHFGVERSVFENLNLALRPPVYRVGRSLPKGYRVRLPINPKVDYQVLLASLYTTKQKAVVAEGTRPAEDWIQVQPGDTLWSISQQLQVSSDVLRDLNELDGSRILVGQILKIPSAPGAPRVPASSVPTVAAASPRGDVSATPTPAPQPPQAPQLAPELAMLDRKAAMPPSHADRQEAEINSYIGMRQSKEEQLTRDWDALMMAAAPTKGTNLQGPLRQWHGSLAVTDVTGEPGKQVGRVTLEPEETLGHFADWLGVPTQTIRRLNHFSYDRQVRLGEKLRVPLGQLTPADLEQKRMEYHQGLQEDFNSNYRIEGVAEYQIKRGDTIWKLCKEELDLPLWLVREYNPDRDLFSLQPGESLTYPVVVPKNPS